MTSRKKWPLAGMIVGALLMLAPLCGVIGTLLGIMNSFGEIARSDNPPDAHALAQGVQTALIATILGLALFPVGLATFVVSLIRYFKSRKPVSA
jgi:biopolymer transport protein ExbB/TolQ